MTDEIVKASTILRERVAELRAFLARTDTTIEEDEKSLEELRARRRARFNDAVAVEIAAAKLEEFEAEGDV